MLEAPYFLFQFRPSRRSVRITTAASAISSVLLLTWTQSFVAYATDYTQRSQAVDAQPSSAQRRLEEINRRLQDDSQPGATSSSESEIIIERSPVPESTPPADSPLSPEFRQYRLGPGDSFFVNVRRFPEANFQATLDLQGNVVVPLAGVINLEGLTIQQAQARLQSELSRFFIDPDVGLTLVAQRPVEVTVLGEVSRPGIYPLPNPDLATALLSAGGATRLANLRVIQIRRPLRNQSGEIVDVVEQNVDLFTPIAAATELPDLQLADGDVVVVPTLTAAEIDTYDRTIIAQSTLAQPEINIRLLDYTRGIRNVTLPGGSDFLDALTTASTDLTNADLSDIALIRFNPEAGAYVTQEINAKHALRGDLNQNPTLEDEDIVVIGRNLIARLSFFFSRVAQPIRDPLQLLFLFDTIVDFVGGEEDN
jgi:polysaccharide export outer membrane protein